MKVDERLKKERKKRERDLVDSVASYSCTQTNPNHLMKERRRQKERERERFYKEI